MAPFAGWEMPIQYRGIVAEHEHTRTQASIFDICHMGEFELSGPSAESDLERLLSQRVSTLHPGQCRYGFLLNDQGGVIDDLTCYRLEKNRFWLVVNAATRAADAKWICSHLSPSTTFTDLSDGIAKLDIQGPTSKAAMERALGVEVPDLKYFYSAPWTIGQTPCLLSRTGYTGEWGYELYFQTDKATLIWEQLLKLGEILPAGLGARDTLRLEVGYPLYGHELGTQRTPVAAVQNRFMDLGKEFIGRDAIQRDLDTGVAEKLVGLRFASKRAARMGDALYQGDHKVGEVTSGSFAPSVGVAIAFAYISTHLAHIGETLHAESRGTRLPCEIVEPPFYKQGSARKSRSQ